MNEILFSVVCQPVAIHAVRQLQNMSKLSR